MKLSKYSILVLILLLSVVSVHATNYYDSFGDSSFNTTLWKNIQIGSTGGSITESGSSIYLKAGTGNNFAGHTIFGSNINLSKNNFNLSINVDMAGYELGTYSGFHTCFYSDQLLTTNNYNNSICVVISPGGSLPYDITVRKIVNGSGTNMLYEPTASINNPTDIKINSLVENGNVSLSISVGATNHNVSFAYTPIYDRITMSTDPISHEAYLKNFNYSFNTVFGLFSLTAKDSLTLAPITTFNATINGTYYATTNGTINTDINISDALIDLTVEADLYENGIYLNYNLSNGALLALLNITTAPLTLTAKSIVSNTTITNWKINNSLYQQSTTNGTIYISLPSTTNTTLNITNTDGWFNISNRNINPSVDGTAFVVYFPEAELNITYYSLITGLQIFNSTRLELNNTDYIYSTDNTTNAGGLNFSSIGYGTYTYRLNATGFAYQEGTFTLNKTNNAIRLNAYTTNSINITFKDSITLAIINTTPISIEIISTIFSNNYSTSTGFKYLDLITPSAYSLRALASGYSRTEYTFTINSGTTQNITVYLVQNNAQNITVNVQDQRGDPIEQAIVKVFKFYPSQNTYLLEQIISTNFAGVAQFPGFINQEYYYFLVEYPTGTQKLITQPTYLFDDVINFQISDYIDESAVSINALKTTGAATFDKTNKQFIFTYNDPTNTAPGGCLYVYTVTSNATDLYNSSCASGSSNTFSVGVTDAGGLSYIAYGYIQTSEGVKYIAFGSGSYSFTPEKKFLIWAIVLVAGFFLIGMLLGDTIVGLLLCPLPLYFTDFIHITNLGFPAIIGIHVLFFIIAFIVKKGDIYG